MSRRVTRPGRRTRKRRALEGARAFWRDYRHAAGSARADLRARGAL